MKGIRGVVAAAATAAVLVIVGMSPLCRRGPRTGA